MRKALAMVFVLTVLVTGKATRPVVFDRNDAQVSGFASR